MWIFIVCDAENLRHPQALAYAALLSVCFFWGTTYLGIRMALESFPPLWLLPVRFITSGSILLVISWLRGAYLPRGRELVTTALSGVLILGISNGALTLAETMIPSGLAALFVTTAAFWMVGAEALIPGGARLHLPTIAGMLVGLAGVVLLLWDSATGHGWNGNTIKGFLVLQGSCITWSLGSILQRRTPAKANPIVGGAVQQLAAGLIYLPAALLWPSHPIDWEGRGVWAILYLVVFGSIVGYSSYVYALSHLPVAILTLYTYINPVVAVSLGWLFYREPFGMRQAAAMAVIFLGVAIVKRVGHPASKKPQREAEPALAD